jgi:hypothetical protein
MNMMPAWFLACPLWAQVLLAVAGPCIVLFGLFHSVRLLLLLLAWLLQLLSDHWHEVLQAKKKLVKVLAHRRSSRAAEEGDHKHTS